MDRRKVVVSGATAAVVIAICTMVTTGLKHSSKPIVDLPTETGGVDPKPTPRTVEPLFTGHVVNATTHLPVANAHVTLIGTGVPRDGETEDNGEFYFPLGDLADVVQIEIIADGYKVRRIAVAPSETTKYIELRPIPTPPLSPSPTPSPLPKPIEKTIDVTSEVDTGIAVRPADKVDISAEGTIDTGSVTEGHAGEIGPDGKDMLLNRMGPFKAPGGQQFQYGALLWKVRGEQAWRLCGSTTTATIEKEGTLLLTINKKNQPYHSGSYQVRVRVYPSG